ncbi:hypothetical protein CVD28_22280 [Bacillus sp. M6-12]|nr:hypothetical protein CVD28_22280 [Bacillus sp. M6-12]
MSQPFLWKNTAAVSLNKTGLVGILEKYSVNYAFSWNKTYFHGNYGTVARVSNFTQEFDRFPRKVSFKPDILFEK